MANLECRIAFGLAAAILVPLGVPYIRKTWLFTAAFTAVYALYTLLPAPRSVVAWGFGIAAVAVSVGMRRPISDLDIAGRHDPGTPSVGARREHLIFLVLILLVALLVIGSDLYESTTPFLHAIKSKLIDDNLSVVISGGLIAIFTGGTVVSYIVTPLAKSAASASGQSSLRLLEAGTHIGWIERSLFFAFFLGGAPDAAALALAAKAFVRAPEPQGGSGSKAEYYLVGSLASVSVSLVLAIATRLALGHSAI